MAGKKHKLKKKKIWKKKLEKLKKWKKIRKINLIPETQKNSWKNLKKNWIKYKWNAKLIQFKKTKNT